MVVLADARLWREITSAAARLGVGAAVSGAGFGFSVSEPDAGMLPSRPVIVVVPSPTTCTMPSPPVATVSADETIAGNAAKKYSNLVYAGIEFGSAPIDATTMTHFHADVWAPSGNVFRIKLVDFGANGIFAGGDDKEQELTFNNSSVPALQFGTWTSFDIPLSDFTNMTTPRR